MIESVLNMLVKCKVCNTFYLPHENVCLCSEEPKVRDYEDVDKTLLSKWQKGEVTL